MISLFSHSRVQEHKSFEVVSSSHPNWRNRYLGIHIRGCPERRCQTVNLKTYERKSEELENESHEDNEDIEEEEEWTYPDEWVFVVIKCLLCTLKKEEDAQRHSIFKTRCTVNERACDLMINSGNNENIVSKTIVDKLKLKTHKYPFPYCIEWIKDIRETKVTK